MGIQNRKIDLPVLLIQSPSRAFLISDYLFSTKATIARCSDKKLFVRNASPGDYELF